MALRIDLVLLTFMLTALPFGLCAQVYKYVDDKGVTRYTDKPPSKDAQPVDLPQIQTYTSDRVLESGEDMASDASIIAPDTVAYGGVQILTPTPEQVFNTGSGKVMASVQVSPELQSGHRLVFMLDGLPLTAGEGQLSLELTGLSRGTHSLQALILDAGDAVQTQSDPVQFHVHQPSSLQPSFDPTPGSAPRPAAGPATPVAPGRQTRPPTVP